MNGARIGGHRLQQGWMLLRGLDAGATALNQANNVPRELVGLRQHGLAGLQHDLVASQGRHLRRHVSIPNDRFARNRVLLQYLESVQVAHDGKHPTSHAAS